MLPMTWKNICSFGSCANAAAMKWIAGSTCVVFTVTAAVYFYLAVCYDAASLNTKEALLGYFHGSRTVATIYTFMAAIGVLTSAMWFWSVHKRRRVWLLPFLAFWVVSCILQFTYIVLVSISYSQMVTHDYARDDGMKEIKKDFALSVTWRTLLLVFELGFLVALCRCYIGMRRQSPEGSLRRAAQMGTVDTNETRANSDVFLFDGKPKI
ncbi:uncharacterized protein LOC135394465 isoform X2 [Ornithodoros turicata]|uniref:uncharacterized protein LOC135394465 isoform X2 n=1 Tax=Ornithodoros turicata TaxID=34597 RepID=UPI00313908DA